MNTDSLLSPEAPKFARSDSLVFSITADKKDSPHDTDLLRDSFPMQPPPSNSYLYSRLNKDRQNDSNSQPQMLTIPLSIVFSKGQSQNSAADQIYKLNNKLGVLQSKVKSIKTQHAQSEQAYSLTYKDRYSIGSDLNQIKNRNRIKTQNENIDISNLSYLQVQKQVQRNAQQSLKVGKFHKKNQIKQVLKNASNISYNNSSFNVTKRRNRSMSHQGNLSNTHSYSNIAYSQIAKKQNQLKSMRKQMLKLRMEVEKSQRSKSKYSQKLSETKQSVRVLESKRKASERLINNLAKDLKKSENIRKKQKQTIARQKQQINQLKRLVNILKSNARQ